VIVFPNYHTLIARIDWFTGNWDDALTEVDAATALSEDFGLHFGGTGNDAIRGLIAFHRGDHDSAHAMLERHQAGVRGTGGEGSGSELLVLLRARLLESRGETVAAARELLGLFEAERALGMRSARLWPGPDCVRLALAAGEDGTAREIADDLDAIAARAGTASGRAAAGLARGIIDGDGDAMTSAAADFARAGRPLDEMLAHEAAAAAMAREGRSDGAITALTRALELSDTLAAHFDARRLTAALRRLGVRGGARGARSRPTHGWESLSPSELEVAKLVADGLTNPKIGERLFISRRTAQTHLSHIYAKLGIGSRVELAAEVLRRNG
jgi:DNA-binding CsgD family transcriptional regulator